MGTTDEESPVLASQSAPEVAEPLLPADEVADDVDRQPASPMVIDADDSYEAPQVQDAACRDAAFAAAFLLQLGVVLVLSVLSIRSLSKLGDPYEDYDYDDDAGGNDDDDGSGLRFILWLVSLIATVLLLSVGIVKVILQALAEMMIKFTLVAGPIVSGLGVASLLITGQFGGALVSSFFCAIAVLYAVRVWHRIPYAKANIDVAVEAVKANRGVVPAAYAVSLSTTFFTVLWALAFAYCYSEGWMTYCQFTFNGECKKEVLTDGGKWIIVGLLVSLCWTLTVFRNVFRVTLAGVVGTWWFAPQDCLERAPGCFAGCSRPLRESFGRASVWSLGSVAFGSLFTAVLSVVKFFVRSAREQRHQMGRSPSLVWCLLHCVVDLLEKVIRYINKWSFVYVGLYGYDYWTSSKKVYSLFRSRGWSVILNDNLVGRSLGMMNFIVGLVSGILAVVLAAVILPTSMGSNEERGVASFFVGLVVGMSVSDIVLQMVSTAVDSVVVCFAEAPQELEANHPELSAALLAAWREAYPSEFTY